MSPHPDDEIIGAGATLIAMQRRGHRVVNLACSLGRPDDRVRRHNELLGATQIAGFDNVILDPPATIGGDEDLDAGVAAVHTAVAALIDELRADIVVSPHPHDGHHGHEAVARGVLAAVKARPKVVWWMWGLWRDLPMPTLYVPYEESVMGVVTRAIAEHRGENERNGYDRMVHGRAAAYRCLGSERVFGFGAPAASPHPYADLLTEARYNTCAHLWQFSAPRTLDAVQPLDHLWSTEDMAWLVEGPPLNDRRRSG
ncbi:PIG-L deacetylase family protein [Gordonia sp. ABKF26]|uniref:PIG-L deacetylase family protein n=1 Tax=Gordonia sp. ABKF26 TaxID=3238687 RepID=UPI0034E555A5